jgi:chromosome segregation ATPase
VLVTVAAKSHAFLLGNTSELERLNELLTRALRSSEAALAATRAQLAEEKRVAEQQRKDLSKLREERARLTMQLESSGSTPPDTLHALTARLVHHLELLKVKPSASHSSSFVSVLSDCCCFLDRAS